MSFSNAAVWQVADVLVHQHGVPLSFIEASPEARVTLSLSRCTLRQLLDKIVESATGYGYGFVGPHLVLYSTDPKWQTRIDALKPASGLRLNVSQALVVQLRRLVPALRRLGVPGLFGNPESFVVQDPVRVAGPGTVVELLTQLLGERISAVFAVSTRGGAPPESLWLDAAEPVQSLEVTAPTTLLRQRGETIQLRVVGLLRDGTRQDMTAAACGTRYVAVDKIVVVSPDGLVTAVAGGETAVAAVHDDMHQAIRLEIVLPGGEHR